MIRQQPLGNDYDVFDDEMQLPGIKSELSDVSLNASTDGWEELRKATQAFPFNEAAWDKLLDKAEESGDLEKIKEAYEALLEKYPNNVRV